MPQLNWLVTGCSSGFGEAFIYEIIARGDRVVATARRAKERLQHLEAAGAFILELDVTWPQQRLDDAMQQAIDVYGGIDILVNNAGYVEAGLLEDVSHERLVEQCNANLFGAINVTRSLLPHFRQRKAGRIAFNGSLRGFVGCALGGPYCITKHGLEAVTDCLQDETSALGIQTIIFEPGNYRTEILGSKMLNNKPSSSASNEENSKIHAETTAAFAALSGHQRGDAKKAVERMVDVLRLEGVAKGRTAMPPRLPIGKDAFEAVRGKCEETLRICEEWEELIGDTDWEG